MTHLYTMHAMGVHMSGVENEIGKTRHAMGLHMSDGENEVG